MSVQETSIKNLHHPLNSEADLQQLREYLKPQPFNGPEILRECLRQTEAEGQIEWLTDLRESVEKDNKEIALASIDSAIKLLKNGTTTI